MKHMLTIFAVCFLLTPFAQAEDATVSAIVLNEQAAKVCTAKCEGSECAGCPIQAAMETLPKFTYQVGKEKTCCSDAAAKLAKQHEAPIHYVLGDKTFETKNVAMVALADATEQYVKAFTTAKTCATSGKTTVAGKELCCEVMAGQRAKLAKTAMAKVNMTYLVGDKSCNCPNEATTLAKSSKAEKFFVVGKEKTCCSTTARLNLARAKYKAAIEALAKADAATAEDQS